MATQKCPRCNKLFEKIRSPICGRCMDDEEADYDKIRQVIDRAPNILNCEDVAEEASVTVECVLRMLDEGLISNAQLNLNVTCGQCGAPAISAAKKLCQNCLDKMNTKMAVEQGQLSAQMGPKKKVEFNVTEGGVRSGNVHQHLVDKRRR